MLKAEVPQNCIEEGESVQVVVRMFEGPEGDARGSTLLRNAL